MVTGTYLVGTLGLAAAVLMTRIAAMKQMVELRRRPAVCASCGRRYTGRKCPSCGRP